jgi:hypothetical protein
VKDIIWLAGFALVILAIIIVTKMLAPQNPDRKEIHFESQTVEKAT